MSHTSESSLFLAKMYFYNFGFVRREVGSFPWSRNDVRDMFYSLIREDTGYSRYQILLCLKELTGEHPHLKYLFVQERLRRENVRAERAYRRHKHEACQAAWFGGGRRAHYMRKHPFGELHHAWLIKKLVKAARCSIDVKDNDVHYIVEDDKEFLVRTVAGRSYYELSGVASPARSLRAKEAVVEDDWYCPQVPVPVVDELPTTKQIYLMKILRQIIRKKQESRKPKAFCFYEPLSSFGDCQMESGIRGDELNKVTSGNVLLTEANPSSSVVTAKIAPEKRWDELCSSEKNTSYDYLTNRFTFFKSFEWTTAMVRGSEIKDIKMDLPCDFLNSVQDPCGMPIFVPFKIFRYMRTDIEIKFHVNSNKFQIGQLQFSWQYMEKYDTDKPDSMYVRSVLPHVVVNAGSSNEATLLIPYKHMLPFIHIHKRKASYQPLYIGTLRCFITAALATGDSGPKTCNISTFIRFPNCQFTGMKDGSIGEPQMEAAATAMIATAVYDKVIGDRNCDNPTAVSVPKYLVPTGSHSWSQGTGLVEPLHRLNLDGNSNGVGRPSGIDTSDTNIGLPSRVFGLIKPFEWSTTSKDTNKAGYLLHSYDAHPQLSKTDYNKEDTEFGMDLYECPPITVVAGMFKQWRGSLEFRFDIIASQFHTGRLLIAYVPGVYGDVSSDGSIGTKITLEQARNCVHAVFSLQDSASFTFVVPYISNTPWWPRKYVGPTKTADFAAPSKLVIFILNPLVRMESVAEKVTILPYFRAGEDFEVSVPVQPSNGLGRNPRVTINSSDYIYPTTGSYPYRATNYSKFGSSKKYIFYEGTAAFGTASTFHAPESSILSYEYYYGKAVKKDNQPMVKWGAPGTPATLRAGYIVLWRSDAASYYGIPFPASLEGERYANEVAKALRLNKSLDEILPYCYDYIEDSTDSIQDMRFVVQKQQIPPDERPKNVRKYRGTCSMSSYEELCDSEMDERVVATNALNPVEKLSSTGNGGLLFNEKFVDFKDYMRRYQRYAEIPVQLGRGFRSGEAICSFPILPSGMDPPDSMPLNPFNVLRDGPIPLVASSYIFFRGSLRFRIMVSSDDIQLHGSKIWVQHIPDAQLPNRLIPKFYGQLSREDRYCAHGYGTYYQPMSVNSIIEIEIPFYQPGMYGLLLPPSAEVRESVDLGQYFTLGNLSIGCLSSNLDKVVQMHISVYYSIGDDMSFSTFRGFPSLVFADEVWESDPVVTGEPQMMSAIASSVVSSIVGSSIVSVSRAALTTTKEQIVELFAGEIAGTVKCKFAPELMTLKGKIDKLHLDVIDGLQDSTSTMAILTALGNIAHVVANPTVKTLAISCANVAISMLGGVVTFLSKLIIAFSDFFSKAWSYFQVEVLEGSQGTVQSDEDLKPVIIGIISVVLTAICGILGFSGKFDVKYFDLIKNVSATAGLANNLVHLFKNLADCINYCIKYVITLIYPDTKYKMLLDINMPAIDKWLAECTYLMDARNKQRYIYDKSMLSRVFDAASVGAILVSNGLDKSCPGGKIIWDTYKEIVKIRNDLIERGAHPDVRFECFPIFFTGSAGIGKSFLTTRISNDLLKSINYSSPGSLIYYIAPGAKYWSGVQNPAVLVSDDMYQVEGTRLEEEIAMMFQICSSSVLNPPMAAVEDKERRLNPLLYLMFCNHAFPDFGSKSRCPEAVYRRRKFLVNVDLTEEIRAKYPNFVDASQLEPSEYENFKHLRFRLAVNVKDINTAYSRWMTYDEMYVIISTKFKAHYASERDNFKQRMCDMYNLDPNFQEYNLIYDIPALGNLDSLGEQLARVKERAAACLARFDDPANNNGDYEIVAYYKNVWKEFMQKLYNKIQSDDPVYGPTTESQTPQDDGFLHTIMSSVRDRVVGQIRTEQKVVEDSFLSPANITLGNSYRTALQNFITESPESLRYAVDQLVAKSGKYNHCLYSSLHYFLKNVDGCGILDQQFSFFVQPSGDPCKVGYVPVVNELFGNFAFDGWEKYSFLANYGNCSKFLVSLFLNSFDNTVPIERKYTQYQHVYNSDAKDISHYVKQVLAECVINKNDVARHFKTVFWNRVMNYLHAKHPELPLSQIFTTVLINGDRKSVLETFDKELRDMLVVMFNSSTSNADLNFVVCSVFGFLISCFIFLDILFPAPCKFTTSLFDIYDDMKHNVKYCHIRNIFSYSGCMPNIDLTTNHPDGVCCHPVLYCLLVLGGRQCVSFHDGSGTNPDTGVVYDSRYIQIFDWANTVANRRKRKQEGFIQKVKSYVSHWFWHLLPKACLLGVIGVIYIAPIALVVWAGYKGLSLMLGWNDPNFKGVCLADGSVQGGRNYFKFDSPKAPTKPSFEIPKKAFNKPQLSAASRTIIANKITNNSVLLQVRWLCNGVPVTRNAKCLMLFGHHMLVLRHYLEEYSAVYKAGFELECSLFFQINDKPVTVPIVYKDLIREVMWCGDELGGSYSSNFGVVILPKQVPLFKNIIPLFATYDSHVNLGATVDIYTICGDCAFNMPVSVDKNYYIRAGDDNSAISMNLAYTYLKQGKGMCGSVLVSPTLNQGNGGIIGIHVAGNSHIGKGAAEPVYREMFEALYRALPETPSEVLSMELGPVEESNIVLDSNLMLYGTVNSKFAHSESGKSKIEPSLLHGIVYPVRTEINPLRAGDKRQPPGSDPLRDGCNKHGSGSIKTYDPDLVTKASAIILDKLYQEIKPVRAEVSPLSLQQAVCGDTDVPYFQPLNWTSSEGFPLSTLRPKGVHDKRWLFDLQQGQFGFQLNKLHKFLDVQMALRDKCFQENKKPITVYVDCLKDYRLSPEKCKIPGKTRIFSIAPIQCTLDVKTHLGDFCASLKNSRIYNSIGIGINPDSYEWTSLVTYLHNVGSNIITLDYSNFGPCLMSQLVAASTDVIVAWHSLNNASSEHVNRVRWLLQNDILNPVHLCGNLVYQTVNGIASGSPVTGECNSIPNLFYILLTYLEIALVSCPEYANGFYYNQYVRIVVYGDDLIMSVHDDIINWFNAVTIQSTLAKHGICVTPASKTGELRAFDTIENSTFLKRGFARHPFREGIWLAPLDTKSIEEVLNWVHASNNAEEALLECVRSSLDLAYSKGPDYYNAHYNKILNGLKDLNLKINVKDWYARDAEIFDENVNSDLASLRCRIPWYYRLSEVTYIET